MPYSLNNDNFYNFYKYFYIVCVGKCHLGCTFPAEIHAYQVTAWHFGFDKTV